MLYRCNQNISVSLYFFVPFVGLVQIQRGKKMGWSVGLPLISRKVVERAQEFTFVRSKVPIQKSYQIALTRKIEHK